tara:strand:- start:2298 stop:2555 length:258 start_codon:yes stop_codon:yes gene_type:complete
LPEEQSSETIISSGKRIWFAAVCEAFAIVVELLYVVITTPILSFLAMVCRFIGIILVLLGVSGSSARCFLEFNEAEIKSCLFILK